MVTAAILAACAALLAAVGEWLHGRRVRRAAHLAFGPSAQPRPWTAVAPYARVLGIAAVVFGGVLLVLYEPEAVKGKRRSQDSRQLLLCLDVSPSMLVEDAGPFQQRRSRIRWAHQAIAPLLDASDTETDSRITLIAFYTQAIPVLVDTDDKHVVANVLDGLELHHAFKAGETDLLGGVNVALRTAAPWARNSATLVVISDGDSEAGFVGLLPRPPSIAETIVMGLGETGRATKIGERFTRQDAASLKALARRLEGTYVDCNQSALSPLVADRLAMRAAAPAVSRLGRDVALLCVGFGSALTALTGPALLRFGRRARGERTNRTRASTQLRGVTS